MEKSAMSMLRGMYKPNKSRAGNVGNEEEKKVKEKAWSRAPFLFARALPFKTPPQL
jgi:hypothetical protein